MGLHPRGGAAESVQRLEKEGPRLSALGVRSGTPGRRATPPPPKLHLGAFKMGQAKKEKNDFFLFLKRLKDDLLFGAMKAISDVKAK